LKFYLFWVFPRLSSFDRFPLFGGAMLLHQFRLDSGQWGLLLFVLATAFFSGVLGGFFFGMTHALRHGVESSKSIWTFDEENS
jgi:hypothetical protein